MWIKLTHAEVPKAEGVSEINHDSVFSFFVRMYMYLPVTSYEIISLQNFTFKYVLNWFYQLSSSTTHSIHHLIRLKLVIWKLNILNSKECERRESYDVSTYDGVLDFWQRGRNVVQTFINQELNEYLAGTTISQHISLNEDEYSSWHEFEFLKAFINACPCRWRFLSV